MQQIDFSQGSIRRRILAVATPMLIAQLLNLLYNIVDRIYIGKIPGEGTLALASIGLCFPFVTLITAFANLFGLGGAPLCAMARGKGNREGAQGIMVNAGFMLLLSGAVLTVLGIAFHRPLLHLFGASEVTYPYASSYIVIYLIGTLCVMLSLGLNPYINCQGFARTGMLTVALGAAANIVLDPIFIFALHLGVRGAAIATVLSQLLSAAWVVKFLTGKKAELKLDFRGFRPDWQCIQRITVLGIASFVMSFTDTLVQVACNATLRNFGGDLYISVMTVLNSVRQIAQTPVLAIADGASTAISYNYGARLYRRTRDAIRFMTQIAIGYTMLVWILVSLFPALFILHFQSGRGAGRGGCSGAAHLLFRLCNDGVPVFRSEHVPRTGPGEIRGVLFAFAQGVHCCAPDFAAAVLLESRCERRICGRAGVQLHRRSGVLLYHAACGDAGA